MSDLPRQYHGDGPVFPGESWHQALGENTAASLAGHLVRWSPVHLGNDYHDLGDEEPGGGLEASRDSTQDADGHTEGSHTPASGLPEPESKSFKPGKPIPSSDWRPPPADAVSAVHAPTDYKSRPPQRDGTPPPRLPQSPRPRRGPGGPSRPRS